MNRWILSLVICLSVIISCKENGSSTQVDKANDEKKALVESLKKEVTAKPDSASVRMRLVNALDSLGLYEEAIAQTDSMIKRDSLNNGLWFAKGSLFESNKDTALAIKSYLRALAIYPSLETQLSLANLYAETKNAAALQLCQNVVNMRLGKEVDGYTNFIAGIYFSRTGNKQQALTLFDKAITNNYTLMEAYMEKGFILFETKKYNEALQTFEKAVTVNNLYADGYYWQAKCYEAMGNKQEAITNYQRSLGLDKNLAEAREALKRLG